MHAIIDHSVILMEFFILRLVFILDKVTVRQYKEKGETQLVEDCYIICQEEPDPTESGLERLLVLQTKIFANLTVLRIPLSEMITFAGIKDFVTKIM